jgi:hypothetical protein
MKCYNEYIFSIILGLGREEDEKESDLNLAKQPLLLLCAITQGVSQYFSPSDVNGM